MRLESIVLRGFRNIAEMYFYPRPGVNVICGENAQGKTNLLEAAWLFTGSRSFRGAKEAEYIAFGGETARLEASFFAQGRVQQASLQWGPDKKKEVALNEISQESASAFGGVFCAVVFSPDHLSLVKSGPECRRRLIDQSLCQAYPKYRKVLESYGRILKQRSSLLRDVALNAQLLNTLDAWDETLLEYGSYLLSVRGRYVKRLGAIASEIYDGISSGREKLSVVYQPGFGGFGGFDETADRKQIREQFENALKNSRARDLQLGFTQAGPHRDDIALSVGGKSARAFGSQGQQRSSVLALKLAECRVLEESSGEPPVVLLDDVMSELDEGRRDYLLHQMGGRQVILTCCDESVFSGVPAGNAVFRIWQGELLE